MEIVIIGTGNTASIMGRMLKAAGHEIVQVYGRDAAAAAALANQLGCGSTHHLASVSRSAQLYVIAVSDIAIPEIVKELQLTDQTVVHTAASVSKDIFANSAEHYGVMYPLQTLKKGTERLPSVPMIIDASDEKTLEKIAVVAGSISQAVVRGDDETRLKLHLAAVFCNNFVNHIYELMQQYCKREDLDFELLLPLIEETTLRLKQLPAAEAQTGPALRRDQLTIEKHRELLKTHPHLLKFYELMTESIQLSH